MWQLGAQPGGQMGCFGFIHHPAFSRSGHRAVEVGVWSFSISRQVSVARP